jgi:hypothetical protein
MRLSVRALNSHILLMEHQFGRDISVCRFLAYNAKEAARWRCHWVAILRCDGS